LTTGPEDVPAYRVPPPENLQSLLERDWAAWEEAKAAIGKARKR
jgi:hypothetical protein